MKLSENIHNCIDAYDASDRSAIIAIPRLERWERGAAEIERDASRAWVSFYVASVVVGLLIAFAVWQRFTLQRAEVAVPLPASPVMQLDPDTVINYPNRTVGI